MEIENTELNFKRKVSTTRKPRRDQITDLTTAAIQISNVTSSTIKKENSNEPESNKKVK